MRKSKRKRRLPAPRTVTFQTSQRGVRFASLEEAREDFIRWLDTGKSRATTEVHIWEGRKKRIVDKIGHDPRGDTLREILRRALRDGRLSIRKMRKN